MDRIETINLGADSITLVVLHVFDARTEKRLLSDRFTNYQPLDFHTGAFSSRNSVADWVRKAVSYELQQTGYNVREGKYAASKGNEVGLIVDIQRVFHYSRLGTFGSEVVLQVTLDKEGKPQITRQYTGVSKKGVGLASTTRAIENFLADALQDAILTMMIDLELLSSSAGQIP